MEQPYPQITFRVNTIREQDINSWPPPDSNINNILLNLKNVTVWVDYVPYALKYGDTFSLYGKEALHVYKQYVQVNKPNLVLEVLYYGIPQVPTPIPTEF